MSTQGFICQHNFHLREFRKKFRYKILRNRKFNHISIIIFLSLKSRSNLSDFFSVAIKGNLVATDGLMDCICSSFQFVNFFISNYKSGNPTSMMASPTRPASEVFLYLSGVLKGLCPPRIPKYRKNGSSFPASASMNFTAASRKTSSISRES